MFNDHVIESHSGHFLFILPFKFKYVTECYCCCRGLFLILLRYREEFVTYMDSVLLSSDQVSNFGASPCSQLLTNKQHSCAVCRRMSPHYISKPNSNVSLFLAAKLKD
jgi:hypothetical protein